MKIIETAEGIRSYRNTLEKEKKVVGMVPTMGALHMGHISLVEKAEKECDEVIVSIFVNPTQFNDPEDLKKYPRTLESDLNLLSERKVSVVFAPNVQEIYPRPDTRQFHFGKLEEGMEGKHRPGHFNGVAQVVSILFDLAKPHRAYFGQKDFQQLAIIRDLVRQLKLPVEIIPCPIIREPNGLAMSSRNKLLTPEQRKEASIIHDTLQQAINLRDNLSPQEISEWATNIINNNPLFRVEYFEIVGTDNLQPVKMWDAPGGKIACTAVKINSIRLIDNMIFP